MKHHVEKKQWGGRFEKKADPLFEKFTSSISYDRKLAIYDIQGSIAHAKMLAKCGVIDNKSSQRIVAGLKAVKKDIENEKVQWDEALEDIHTHVEVALRKKIGSVADKLHTARSRNDQVALDLRLYLKDECDKVISLLTHLQATLWKQARAHEDLIIPAYTHLRRAQPVLFAHYLLAYVEMFERDKERLKDHYKRLDVLPLGSCALAGTSISIDRHYLAKLLGFKAISENSMDAVSDRDFAVEFLSAVAIMGVHLSRISEDLLLWSSDEFDYIVLPQSFCSGSSAMPHKMNPDVLELLRGKGARLIANLLQILCMLKSLPLTYNRDLQDDKESVFDSVESITGMLQVFTALMAKIKVKKDKLKQATHEDYSWLIQRNQ